MEIKTVGTEIAYVGQGIAFPSQVKLSTPIDKSPSMGLTFTVVYSHEMRRYVLRETIIGSPDSPFEITGQVIRSIPFQEILQSGLKRLKYFDTNTQQLSLTAALDYKPLDRDELIKSGPVKKSLEAVALLYRIAEVLGANQGKHVERALNIPYATAANWIQRARSHGAFEAIEDPSKMFLPLGSQAVKLASESFFESN